MIWRFALWPLYALLAAFVWLFEPMTDEGRRDAMTRIWYAYRRQVGLD